MDILSVIWTLGSITGCFFLGFSIGTILERKRLITQCEWDLNIMERLSRMEDALAEIEEYDETEELNGIKLIKIQFDKSTNDDD